MTGQLCAENLGVHNSYPNTPADKTTFQKRIKRVLNRQENKICLDCSRPNPRWASIITLPPPTDRPTDTSTDDFSFGGFCCLECSGAHRTLGTHLNFVRSVDFDSLKEREVQILEATGNAAVNSIFEGRLFSTEVGGRGIAVSFTKEIKPDASSDQNTRELFIRNKYSKKMYLDVVALNRYHRTLASPFEFGGSHTLITTPSSTSESTCAPPQLQIFTSSPRTLAMLEKYMNPKPKKKKLSKRIKDALGMKKNMSEGSIREGSIPTSQHRISMPASLKILQTRSIDETEDNCCASAYSDSEYNIELVKRKGTSLADLNEVSSMISTKSSMSATRRRRWISKNKKGQGRSRRKNKKLKKNKSQAKLESPLVTSHCCAFNFDGGGTHYDPKIKLDSSMTACSSVLNPAKFVVSPRLCIVDEDSSRYSTNQSKNEEDSIREVEISLMALWSRGIEWAIFKRFRTTETL